MEQQHSEVAMHATSKEGGGHFAPESQETLTGPKQDTQLAVLGASDDYEYLQELPDYITDELGIEQTPEPEAASEQYVENQAGEHPVNGTFPAVVEAVALELIRAERCEIDVEGVTYSASEDRLFLVTQKGETITENFVSRLIVVVAEARSTSGNRWGKVVKFEDQDGNLKQMYIPNADITTNGTAVVRSLVESGLVVSTQRGATDALLHYLNLAPPLEEEKATCTDRIGWHENAYLFPDSSFIGTAGTRVIYTGTQVVSNTTSGTLQEWKDNVATLCQGNSLLVLAVCIAFGSVLLRLLDEESGGYHIFGESSTGKSTTLYVAASVHGEPRDLIGSWRTTANGAEARAKHSNDALLVNDELHQASNPKEAGELAYMYMNGKGKQRANQLGDARKVAEWRLNCLSSGEVSYAAYIESGGTSARAGQAVRMLDISADMGEGLGIFEDIHDLEDGRRFSEALKTASSTYYGTPIRAFLTNLPDIDRIKDHLSDIKLDFFEKFVPQGADSQVQRVASKMAVVALAGEMATEMDVTGWTTGEAFEAVGRTFGRWLALRGTVGQQEPEMAIEQIKSFLRCHGMSRFMQVTERLNGGGYALQGPERTIINMAGYRVVKQNDVMEFIVYPHVFTGEMCLGLNPGTVTKTLVDRGFLMLDTQGKPQVRRRLPGIDQARVYHFRSTILADAEETEAEEPDNLEILPEALVT